MAKGFVKHKILVAMSGGVDSLVAAALLMAQGNEVIGVYFDLGNPDSKEKMIKAEVIAKKLEIEFKTIDIAKIFKKEIIDEFVKDYEQGITPNPCVVCNKKIKFDFLLREMKRLGCDFAATGHYAQIFPSIIGRDRNVWKSKKYQLLTAKDETKDQSYFLYTLTQKQLAKLVFPLGEYTKEKVKKMAEQMGFESDKESQDICFLAGTSCNEFLQKNIKAKPGKIRDTKGEIVGEHQGLFKYTIGQRRGIEIGGSGPYYVVRKDYSTNELLVTNNEEDISLTKDFLTLANVNWIEGKEPKMPLKGYARIRYQGELVLCSVCHADDNSEVYEVYFTKAQKAVTPGQSIVFYKGTKEILGGGVIN